MRNFFKELEQVRQEVRFALQPETIEIPPYGEAYGRPGDTFVLFGPVSNAPEKHMLGTEPILLFPGVVLF